MILFMSEIWNSVTILSRALRGYNTNYSAKVTKLMKATVEGALCLQGLQSRSVVNIWV